MTHPLPRLTRDELYDYIVARIPFHRLQGWEGVSGEEFLRMLAAIWERVLHRLADRLEGVFILQATGEGRAAGLVRIVRTDTTEAVGWRRGQVIASTPWGVTFRLVEDTEFAPAVGTLSDVAIEAEWSGWEGNVRPAEVSEWGLPDGVDPASEIAWLEGISDSSKATFLAEVEAGDATIVGNQAGEWFEGGSLATLDLLGNERGLPRYDGEPDPSYRKRVRQLPNMVTPGGILRAVQLIVEPLGATATLEEPWDYAWTVGDSELGTIGDNGVCPIAGRPSFAVMISGLPYESEGWVVGDDPNGTIGDDYPIGVGDTEHAGIMAALQGLVDRIRLAGVDGQVFEEVS